MHAVLRGRPGQPGRVVPLLRLRNLLLVQRQPYRQHVQMAAWLPAEAFGHGRQGLVVGVHGPENRHAQYHSSIHR